MRSRGMSGFICSLIMMIFQACGSVTAEPGTATPPSAPETVTATPATAAPSATPLPTATPLPQDAIGPDAVEQVRLLHEYWLAVATAAGVDPFEMDISSIAVSADGSLLAVGGCSKPLQADLRSGNVYCRDDEPEREAAIPFLLILDAGTESVIASIPENQVGTTIADLAFTHDGSKLIYAVHSGKFVMWDLLSGKVEAVLWVGDTSAPRIAVSPDGRWIALKTTDQARIWDTVHGDFAADIPGYFRPQFSADSSRVSVYHDTNFMIYDTVAWKAVTRFKLPCNCAYAFSPDLSLLATSDRAASENAATLIWHLTSSRQVNSLQAGRGYTAFLSFSPDGKLLWRAGDVGDLVAWDTSTWGLLGDNIAGATPRFNVRGFQFTDDGRHFVILSHMHIGLYGLPSVEQAELR